MAVVVVVAVAVAADAAAAAMATAAAAAAAVAAVVVDVSSSSISPDESTKGSVTATAADTVAAIVAVSLRTGREYTIFGSTPCTHNSNTCAHCNTQKGLLGYFEAQGFSHAILRKRRGTILWNVQNRRDFKY